MVNQVNKNQQTALYSAQQKTAQQKVEKSESQAVTQQQAPSLKTPTASDSVSLTPQAQQLKALHEKAQQAPDFDQKKVDSLKKAIADGNYQVDAEKLAQNITSFEFDLYG